MSAFHPKGQYLDIHQTRSHTPSDYENLLGDALERSYAAGIVELDGIVKELDAGGVPAPNGHAWSNDLLASELKRLGA